MAATPLTGLVHEQNTCYIAAALQLIIGEPGIVQSVRDAVDLNAQPLARRFCELINVMCEAVPGTIVDMRLFLDALFDQHSHWTKPPYNAVRGQQQSADEFLQFLLEEIPGLAVYVSFSERTLPATAWQAGSTTLNVELAPGARLPLTTLIHAQYAGSDGLNANPVVLGHLNDLIFVVVKRWHNRSGHVTKDNTEFSLSEPLDIFDTDGIIMAQYTNAGFIGHSGTYGNGHYTTHSKRMVDGADAYLLFDDVKPIAYEPRDTAQAINFGGRTGFVMLYRRIGDGGGALMSPEIAQQVAEVKEAIREQQAADEWENADVSIISKAHELAGPVKQLRASLGPSALAVVPQFIEPLIQHLIREFACSQSLAKRAMEHAMTTASPGPTVTTLTLNAIPVVDGLPMWNDRVNWAINDHIPDRNLVYLLVHAIVVQHAVYRELLSYCLNDPDYLIFIQRPEQSGKTFTCTLVAWLSNLCYGQAAYVLLRTGSGASEDYEKYGLTVDQLNKMIWEVMVGYTFEGSGNARTFHKLPPERYDERICKDAFPNMPALEGFMNPFVLHSFDLHKDKKLESDTARRVLQYKYPIVFSRLCSPANIMRAQDNEIMTIIRHYGVDEHGFAKMTLLNDEYQQNIKEGTRTQEELHDPLSNAMFHNLASAINEGAATTMTDDETAEELLRRFKAWEDKKPDERADTRFIRSWTSAGIRGQVRISATTVSGQVTAEDLDLRVAAPIELPVDESYYGHNTSVGIDPSKSMKIEWRGSSNLEFLEVGDYPNLPSPPKIQKFIMDEIYAELAREGYAHILFQVIGGNNSALFDIAQFLIAFADEEIAEKPVIAVTAYMYTTAGQYPGGPWLVFSQAALPLRPLIADIAENLYIDSDRRVAAAVQPGKVALNKGSLIAPGIRNNMSRYAGHANLRNALQLPKHGAMFLKYILALVDRAVEQLGYMKANVKVITIGAGLLKVGMTPKTFDHKMSVTLGLLSATERQVKNLTGEDISQSLHGRCSGPRDDRDPYWAARGDDTPPRLVASGFYKDLLTTYKKIQAHTMQVAKQRIQTAQAGTIIEAMTNLDFNGFSDLPANTKLFNAGKKARFDDANGVAVGAVKRNSTGQGLWSQSRNQGFRFNGADTDEMIAKFGELEAEYPGLFATNFPGISMPKWKATIYKKWDPSFPHYRATVIDVRLVTEADNDERLKYTIRYDTDEDGNPLEDNDDKYIREHELDPDMNEWGYDNPNIEPLPMLLGP